MSTDHFDLIVIGSGPAGEKEAAQAAYFGKRVALVEKEALLLANTGTLPSKTLPETAFVLSGAPARPVRTGCRLEEGRERAGRSSLLLNAPADLFIPTCYNYPTLTAVYNYAA